MLRRTLLLALAVCAVITGIQFAQPTPQLVDVLTQHNNNARTGANLRETILTPATVNKDRFGKLFDFPVDGQIYAQPLVVSGLRIGGRVRNVVYIATQHNSVYAMDADTGEQIWFKNLGPSMPTPNAFLPAPSNQTPYKDLNPEQGITSTPVIDRDTNTIYLTSFVQQHSTEPPGAIFTHYLNALSLTDGTPKLGSPGEIDGCVMSREAQQVNAGKRHWGRHRLSAQLCFDPLQHLQRPALLLVKAKGAIPQIILAFGSHADYAPYHGWVMSYNANDVTKQLGIWATNTTADNEDDGGIWMSGMGPALDDSNYFYLITGNGKANADTAFGESFLKFSTANNTIALADFFTACNQSALDAVDEDLGSSGPFLLNDPSLKPRPQLVAGGGKQGRLYVLQQSSLGKGPATCDANGNDPNIYQEFQATRTGEFGHTQHIHGSPVYWRSAARGPVIYVWGENDNLRAYQLTLQNGQWKFQTNPQPWSVGAALSPAKPWNPTGSMMTGGILSLSSNGDRDGILWATTPTNNDANQRTVPGILRAYDANDLGNELWNSYQNRFYDDFGNYAKFTPPTVANGKVYLATFSNQLSVYGLLNNRIRPAIPTNLIRNGGFEEGTTFWSGTAVRFSTQPNYPYFGTFNAILCTAIQTLPQYGPVTCPPIGHDVPPLAAQLSQSLAAPKTGHYSLRALCATNILPRNVTLTPHGQQPQDVVLAVDVAGRTVGRQTVLANRGYHLYTIDFEAFQGEVIRVWYSAPGAVTKGAPARKLIDPDSWAVIDEVQLISH